MENFIKNRNIEQVKIPTGHPSPNNAERVMKPLCKVIRENGTLSSFLVNYGNTPNFATCVFPAQMIFLDRYWSNLPHKSLYIWSENKCC